MDSIVLFLIFSFSAAALIAAISVLGYGILLDSALPVAVLGGLSAGCLGLFSTWIGGRRPVPARGANRAASPDRRDRVPSLSDEMERAGRSITAG